MTVKTAANGAPEAASIGSSLLNNSCRWEELVEKVLRPIEVLFYAGEADYQGSAAVLVRRADGMIVAYEWSWGSCSGCDPWEDELEENVLAKSARVPTRCLLTSPSRTSRAS